MATATSFYNFEPKDRKGTPSPLSQYENKVVLIVNTATKCGFTPQFEGLEKIYKDLGTKYPNDFTILGFPCNQFGNQNPENDDETHQVCQLNYGLTFPLMGQVEVNGDGADPLWKWLKTEKPGFLGVKMVKWNFEKFLVGRDGKVKQRWASTTKPEALEKAILAEINSKA